MVKAFFLNWKTKPKVNNKNINIVFLGPYASVQKGCCETKSTNYFQHEETPTSIGPGIAQPNSPNSKIDPLIYLGNKTINEWRKNGVTRTPKPDGDCWCSEGATTELEQIANRINNQEILVFSSYLHRSFDIKFASNDSSVECSNTWHGGALWRHGALLHDQTNCDSL